MEIIKMAQFKKYSVEEIFNIMEQLYDEKNGCQWIKDQDFKTIAKYTIEEALEVVDAVKRENIVDLKDELGDLLFQIVFYSFIAQKENKFMFNDIVNAICDKLKRRNTHIFDTKIAEQYKLAEDKVAFASEQWQKEKEKEKESKS